MPAWCRTLSTASCSSGTCGGTPPLPARCTTGQPQHYVARAELVRLQSEFPMRMCTHCALCLLPLQGSSPLLRKLASRRAARAGSASMGGASPTPSYTTGPADSPAPPPLPPLSPPAATANGQPGLLHTPAGPSSRGLPPAPGSTVGTPAAGAATPAAGVPTQAVTGQDAVSADSSLQDGVQRRETASQTGDSPPARNYLEQVCLQTLAGLALQRHCALRLLCSITHLPLMPC